MDEMARQAMKPKRETQLLTGLVSSHGGNLLAPGTLGTPGSFSTFIVSEALDYADMADYCRKLLVLHEVGRRNSRPRVCLKTSS